MNKLNEVVIIEDDIGLSCLMSDIVSEIGLTPRVFYTGYDALKYFEENSPLLIVLDYSLPDLNGKEILAKISEISKALPPFIVTTGHGDEKIAVEMMKMGAEDYIVKDNIFLNMLPVTARKVKEKADRIDKLKQAEEALRQSEENYKFLFHTMSQGVVYQDAVGNIILANPAAERILGLTMEQMKGKTSFDPRWRMINLDGLDVQGADHPAMVALRTGKKIGPVINGVYIPEKDEYVWISIIAIPLFRNGEPKPYQVYATIEDVTTQKLMQDSLRKSEELYRTVIQTALDGFWISDMEGYIKVVNETYCKMSGYTEAELMGIHISQLEYYEASKETHAHIEKVMQTGSDRFETKHIRKDGSVFDLEVSVQYLPFEEGQLVVFLSDITERKKSEKDIKERNLELAELNSSKDKFFSIIAHDLRSPFVGFLGLTNVLAESINTLSIADLQEISKALNESATKLYSLLLNLLEWSNIQRGKIQFNPQPITLLSLINISTENFLESLKNKELSIEIRAIDKVELCADREMINSILRNLISNAIKFSNRGNRIVVGASEVSDNTDKRVRLFVQDFGIGMDKELLNDLFKLDGKTSREGTENEHSSGLGLILCKEFVDIHTGKIWAESEENVGTTFYIELPKEQKRE